MKEYEVTLERRDSLLEVHEVITSFFKAESPNELMSKVHWVHGDAIDVLDVVEFE